MIEIKGLNQSYQNKQVLLDIHLRIKEKEIWALVGRNGAGKSTLIHSLVGILPFKRGEIIIKGIPHRCDSWKKHVAYLPEKFQLYPQLTGEENLRFFAELVSQEAEEEKLESCLRSVHLFEDRKEKIKSYSKGMLQRLGLGIMLYFDSDILILDEPTSGLDPMGRMEILSILKSLTKKTILFSSHHMEEIRQICSHVAYLENGTISSYSIEDFDEKLMNGRILQ